MNADKLLIKNASELVTCKGFEARAGRRMGELDIIANGALAIEDGKITHVGTTEEVLAVIQPEAYTTIDAAGKAVLPGFIDAHTHFIFGGYRQDEYRWRLEGASYIEIMQRGGGIANTMQATRKANRNELLKLGRQRLDAMLGMGVTTVEGKSGYGLDLDTEVKQLEVMAKLDRTHEVDVVPTFLGAHALPPEYKNRSDAYIDWLCHTVLPQVAQRRLADFCDVFCEQGVFSVSQSRRLLQRARSLGLKLKLHADEIVSLGGAELAAEIGAVSADHLLQASDAGITAMARAGVVATLLPATAFSLKEPFARARHIIDSGCAAALATDFNPGSSFTFSIPLIIALATLQMAMSPEEAIIAVTINAAAALDRANRIGSLDVGKAADAVILAYPSHLFLAYHLGINIVEKVIKNGRLVIDRSLRATTNQRGHNV
jgi:imidazolonepropionase